MRKRQPFAGQRDDGLSGTNVDRARLVLGALDLGLELKDLLVELLVLFLDLLVQVLENLVQVFFLSSTGSSGHQDCSHKMGSDQIERAGSTSGLVKTGRRSIT